MGEKYNWETCKRCHSSFIPWKEKQTYCSFWCEMLDEKAGKRDVPEDDEWWMGEVAKVSMDWQERKVNDIDTNPVECWWAIGEFGNLRRFYKVVPFNRCDEFGRTTSNGEFYVLHESLSEDEGKAFPVAVYDTLEQAKVRARFQLVAISSIVCDYPELGPMAFIGPTS